MTFSEYGMGTKCNNQIVRHYVKHAQIIWNLQNYMLLMTIVADYRSYRPSVYSCNSCCKSTVL